jgi:hypothetical protein
MLTAADRLVVALKKTLSHVLAGTRVSVPVSPQEGGGAVPDREARINSL